MIAVGRSAEPVAASALREGEMLAPGYTVLAHLHRSRELDVYDVWSAERACRCTAKVLRPDRSDDPDARDRLLAEGRLLLGLTHPHLARAYALLDASAPVLVLETLTGETLANLLGGRRRRLPLTAVAYLGLHLCSALRYLHHHRVLHLDLKPSNIVADRGLAKVLDLSIARSPGPGRRGWGTPQYMAPEQVRGDPFTATTDVWGLGTVLYEAASGRRPFNVDGSRERHEQLLRRADPIRAYRRLPAPLAAAIDRCLHPDQTGRPTVAELAHVLEGVLTP